MVLASDAAGGIPIVRTTTRYTAPAQRFSAVHTQLAARIQRDGVAFNNALVERYTQIYRTMGAHSDQALDLADDSFIAVFSSYRHPERGHARKLVIEAKDGTPPFDVPLLHNGVVRFSLATNRRHKHKIVLIDGAADNEWLGFTLRTSKTYVRFRGEQALLDGDIPLTLANEAQRAEFLGLRRRENGEPDFIYPRISYTLSESDLLLPQRG